MRSFTHLGNVTNAALPSVTSLSLRSVGIKRLAFDVYEYLGTERRTRLCVGAGYGALVSNNTRRFVEAEVLPPAPRRPSAPGRLGTLAKLRRTVRYLRI
jgi:hypothetical protein